MLKKALYDPDADSYQNTNQLKPPLLVTASKQQSQVDIGKNAEFDLRFTKQLMKFE